MTRRITIIDRRRSREPFLRLLCSGIVKSDARSIAARIKKLGREHGVETSVAWDCLKPQLRRRSGQCERRSDAENEGHHPK